MERSLIMKNNFARGAWTAVPIAVGYFPIAIAFGVISIQAGIPLAQTVSMSLIVYAGASQFMAAGMVAAGAGFAEIVLATFVLNLRHFIMSMSLMDRLKMIPKEWKPLLSFGITDETFAVLSLKEDGNGREQGQLYVLGLMAAAYGSWVVGTMVGAVFANVIPPSVSASMSIGLYAMFIGLLVPAVRSAWKFGIIVAFSMVLSTVFGLFLNRGWAIVLATVLAAASGIFLHQED